MGSRSITMLVLIAVGLGLVIACMNGYMGQNDDQNWQVLQGVFGKMRIQTDAGYFQKQFASDFTYPKLRQTYFSDDIEEGGAKDGSCKVIFKDKGRATFSSTVVYNTPYILAGDAIDENIKGLVESPTAGFHRLCKGDVTKADLLILARLKEYAIGTAEKLNASDCAENQSVYIDTVSKLLKSDELLISKGINIEMLALSGFTFDDTTLLQFKTQQDAILASKAAEAKKIQFEMQELETVAEYAQLIAKEKGIADMVKMTQITEAERDKELAEISAAKDVAVAKLSKEKAETIAAMALSVNKIDKEAAIVIADQGLEVATIAALEAEQLKLAVIAEAEGKEKAIQLSGAITEKEEILAKIAAQRDVEVSANISQMASPDNVFISNGQGGSSGGGSMGTWFGQLMGYGMGQKFGIISADAVPVAPVLAPTK